MLKTGNHQFILSFEGNRILRVGVFDLLGVAVDAIVNPANSGLSHGGGLAAAIADEAGPQLEKQCRMAFRKLGRIPVNQNVVTTAGNLPYKGVIHAVGPRMGDGDEQGKLERTVWNCLKRAESRGWKFAMASGEGSTFIEDMGCRTEAHWLPGVSTFRKLEDGSVVRVAQAMFGPGDAFCGLWHLFGLLADGPNKWQPKFDYS